MAAGKTENTRGVEQTEKKVPRITGEVASGHHVSKLVYGVNIFELDFRVQFKYVKQPIKRDFVRSGKVSHHRTSTFHDLLGHCFSVLKNVKHAFEVRRFCACDNVVHIGQLIILSVTVLLRFGVGGGACFGSHLATGLPVPER